LDIECEGLLVDDIEALGLRVEEILFEIDLEIDLLKLAEGDLVADILADLV